MGLDMFLMKRDKIRPSNDFISNYGEEIMYWRKANQIRQWFVNHIEEFNSGDNGEKYIISKQLLEDLVDDISIVLNDRNRAVDLLPTSSGFFFGSQDYDEFYFDCLEMTKEELKDIITDFDWENEEIYYIESW